MTAVAVKGSSGFPGQLFKQAEVAGEKTTWLFHLAKSADGTDDTGVVPVVTISKAGGAFGAAAGVVTEISGGWYKVAFTAADLSTLGALAINVAVATADSINEVAQVVAFDPYDAVHLGLSALPAAASGSTNGIALANDVIDATTPSRHTQHDLGTLTTSARTSTAKSIAHAVTAQMVIGGNFAGSASVQVQVTEDGTNWTNYGSAQTSAGTVDITEPHFGVRATMSSGNGSTATTTILKINTNAA